MENVTVVSFNDFRQFAAEIIKNEIQNALAKNQKHDKMSEEKLYSRQELAEYLGLSVASITNYKNEGMPFLRHKRRPYFKLKEVEQFLGQKQKKRDRF